MTYYVIEQNYVGPNPDDDERIDSHIVRISREPARANMSGEPRITGWCGTTNDLNVHAHGEYETLEAAIDAVSSHFGAVRDREIEVDRDDVDVIVAEFAVGQFQPLGADAVCDYLSTMPEDDITADTTDERLGELVEQYEAAANGEGLTLGDLARRELERRRDYCEQKSRGVHE